jgi:peptidyl-dipeptidase A
MLLRPTALDHAGRCRPPSSIHRFEDSMSTLRVALGLIAAITLTSATPAKTTTPKSGADTRTQTLTAAPKGIQERADRFLQLVNAGYQSLGRVAAEAQWVASTDVSDAHDAASEAANKSYAAFNGNPELIREARELLQHKASLTPVTVRQLNRVLLNAAEGPMTNRPLAEKRIAAEVKQASTLNGFEFKLDGKPITVNEIQSELTNGRDLARRKKVWEASKESGPALKDGLIKLRDLRNGCAKELGYPDYFALQSAGYGMTADEIVAMQDRFMKDMEPLYKQLHTWVRYELAKRYNQPVPKRIPAHWIDNRWSQEWGGIAPVANLDERFKGKNGEWVVKKAEEFYTGLGYPKLPDSFWEKSDLYPVAADSKRKKNTHASAWHIDLDNDIRSLMSVEPNEEWFKTSHHELGHAYYYVSYTRPQVPPLLRLGANPSFHEGMGELISLAAGQVPYLKHVGLLRPDEQPDSIAFLLNDALTNGLPFIFWASGTMTHWEHDVYSKGLPPDQWNARWWQYVADFQGVEPPSPRGEQYCDAATKTHINDTPCYYYSYAIATVFKFQMNDHIARKILHQSPRNCNYADNKQVGEFLRTVMAKGGTEDWRKVLKDATGEDLSTRAMAEYFRPLEKWLEIQNRGREIGW